MDDTWPPTPTAPTGMKNALRAGVHSIEHATLMDDDAAEMMTQRHVYMVPTLSALATTAACPTGCGIPDSARSKARNMVKQHERSFRTALRRGVPIALGTDAGTPFNDHGNNAQELERMVALGMTPMDAIMTSTSAAARLLGLTQEIGSIAAGKQADLLFVEGNPLRNIGVLLKRERTCSSDAARSIRGGSTLRAREPGDTNDAGRHRRS
jgi:imidazolonepropionase-like amidohydrolase